MQIIRYTPEHLSEWDAFVAASRNATFLHHRGYMDYHADRFADRSLLFYDDGKLIALLPANERGSTLYSHQGLTYGALLLADATRAEQVEACFDALVGYLRAEGFAELVYKPVPPIYHRLPSMEDVYFLFRHGAERTACALASTIDLSEPPLLGHGRRYALSRAAKLGLTVAETLELAPYWSLMEANLLTRYGVHPVHRVDEMELLRSRFPEQIRLFCAYEGAELLAGVLLYDVGRCIRIQYSNASPRGKELNALDVVYAYLLKYYAGKRTWFDFGQCTEADGHVLNHGLLRYKESFGGRATLYETYTLHL